jgi:hypothetical protein
MVLCSAVFFCGWVLELSARSDFARVGMATIHFVSVLNVEQTELSQSHVESFNAGSLTPRREDAKVEMWN